MEVHFDRRLAPIGLDREDCTVEKEIAVVPPDDPSPEHQRVVGIAASAALGRMVGPAEELVSVVGMSARESDVGPESVASESYAPVSVRPLRFPVWPSITYRVTLVLDLRFFRWHAGRRGPNEGLEVPVIVNLVDYLTQALRLWALGACLQRADAYAIVQEKPLIKGRLTRAISQPLSEL